MQPANRMGGEPAAGNRLMVVVRGEGVVTAGGTTEVAAVQDAIFCPAGTSLDLRATHDAPLCMVTVEEAAAAGA